MAMIPTNVKSTLNDMIKDRNYKLIEKNDDNIRCIDSENKYTYINFNIIEKFNVDIFKKCVELLKSISDEKMNYNHLILVYSNKITPIGGKLLRNNINVTIELFHIDSLKINITKHILVPIHLRLTASENKQFREQYGNKIPRLLTSDPISRYYNFKKDDIIKIIRNKAEILASNGISYRIVI